MDARQMQGDGGGGAVPLLFAQADRRREKRGSIVNCSAKIGAEHGASAVVLHVRLPSAARSRLESTDRAI